MAGDSRRVSDRIRENYREVREQRGLSWAQMADQFAKDGHVDLEAWAREEAKIGDKSARANKGSERAVNTPPRRG